MLIEQINDYIAAREVSLNIERISIRDITARLRDEFSDLLQKHHVAWSEPSALPEIMAYELCVTRDFRNLVNNALKYGGEGLSEIRIDYEESEEHHVFSVSDNGIGIKRKDVARLFQLFYRHKTSKGKEVVKKHLEEVRVEFEPGQWNTFYMLLPKTLKPAGGWWKGK